MATTTVDLDPNGIAKNTFGAANNLGAAQNDEVVIDNKPGLTSACFRLVIPSGGTVVFEGTHNGSTWFPFAARWIQENALVFEATVDGDFIVMIAGLLKFRARVSSAGGGAGSVIGRLTHVQMEIEQLTPRRPTYMIPVSGQANTGASHAIAVESGAAKTTRVHRVIIFQPGLQTTAGLRVLQLLRTTAAGSSGAVTPQKLDPTDPAFTGIARAKPTPGTEGAVLLEIPIFVPTAVAAFTPISVDLEALLGKPVEIPVGTANGVALKDPGATGGASFSAALVVSEQ